MQNAPPSLRHLALAVIACTLCVGASAIQTDAQQAAQAEENIMVGSPKSEFFQASRETRTQPHIVFLSSQHDTVSPAVEGLAAVSQRP